MAISLVLAATARAGFDGGLCKSNTARGSIPSNFFIDGCFDGQTLTLYNDSEVVLHVDVTGISSAKRTETNYDLPTDTARFSTHNPWILLPGDILKMPVGSAAAKIGVSQATTTDEIYRLAQVVASAAPFSSEAKAAAKAGTLSTAAGAAKDVADKVNTLAGLLGELAADYQQYHQCLSGASWLAQLGCRALLVRNVSFAYGRAGVSLGADGLSLLLSPLAFIKFTYARVQDQALLDKDTGVIRINAIGTSSTSTTPTTSSNPTTTTTTTSQPAGLQISGVDLGDDGFTFSFSGNLTLGSASTNTEDENPPFENVAAPATGSASLQNTSSGYVAQPQQVPLIGVFGTYPQNGAICRLAQVDEFAPGPGNLCALDLAEFAASCNHTFDSLGSNQTIPLVAWPHFIDYDLNVLAPGQCDIGGFEMPTTVDIRSLNSSVVPGVVAELDKPPTSWLVVDEGSTVDQDIDPATGDTASCRSDEAYVQGDIFVGQVLASQPSGITGCLAGG